ncbi:MAG: branched-chain amino acid ABC transporter permease [Deltaproteobacteria bacterium]|nr:branched-chain amino acid ABC transporter permease [Deltaproteobacteria bacterium]
MLSLGGTYALLALGLAVVFSIMGLINFAHGELIAITGYTMFFLAMTGLPWAFIIAGAILVSAVAAILMERIAFRPIRNASATTGLMTTFAVMMILQVAWSNLISPLRQSVVVPGVLAGTTHLGQAAIGNIQIIAIIVSAVSLIGLTVFLKRTTLGIAMRASAQDFPVTRLMGIRANRVVATTFLISGLLAGIAGVLWISQRAMVDPHVGLHPVLKAFIAVVFGGLHSLGGAVLGGLILGCVETALRTFLPDSLLPYREALELTVVILILLRWSGGLLTIIGQKREIKAD